MNPEIKKRWVEALRSGEYRQGSSMLKNTDESFCCLGVLCDLHSKETGTAWCGIGRASYKGKFVDLPMEVIDWSGLVYADPGIHCRSLSQINDSGTPFSEIANLIEQNL